MDKLEEHIRKHREDLDRYSPPKSIWRKISRELGTDRPLLKQWISIAAMIVVILGSAVVLFRPEYRGSDRNTQRNNDDNSAQITPQLKETEVYYNNLVNMLYNEAAPLLTKNPDIKKELNTDMSHLDSICIDLKKDLKDNIANQDVVEALIRNYRIKIQILEDMLVVLKQNDSIPEKKKSHEL
jgi:hypothetical protein